MTVFTVDFKNKWTYMTWTRFKKDLLFGNRVKAQAFIDSRVKLNKYADTEYRVVGVEVQ